MSAPREVFVAFQITAPNADGLAMPVDTYFGPNKNIRYLRADLVDDLIAAGAILADAYDPARTHIGAQYATAWDAAVAKIKGEQ